MTTSRALRRRIARTRSGRTAPATVALGAGEAQLPTATRRFTDDPGQVRGRRRGLRRASQAAGHAPPGDPPRTTNLLERLFVEERGRLKIIPNRFGEKAVLKLMFGALVRAADRWRGLRFTEFETRQLAAVRKDLDNGYAASLKPKAAAAQPAFSSSSRP